MEPLRDEAAASGAAAAADESASPVVVAPGVYRCVCVSLRLHHLAVAAVDQAALLAEASGALTLEGLLGGAAPAFKVLRDLVQVMDVRCIALRHQCWYTYTCVPGQGRGQEGGVTTMTAVIIGSICGHQQ